MLARIDTAAERTGRRWQDVLAEVLAYYTLKEREKRTDDTKQALAEYLAQGRKGKIPGTFGNDGPKGKGPKGGRA